MAGRPQRPIPGTLPSVGNTATLSVGAKKALGNFIHDYGREKGVEVFVKKAEEQGAGSTLRQKINSTYHKGATLRG